jgi:hypothetical protein
VAYRFDYLVAPLPCGRCGAVSEPDASMKMTTRLRDDPRQAHLTVGDALPVDTPRALRSGYFLQHEPEPGAPAVLLHQWTCTACGNADNWAEVVVGGGVITSIRAVELNQDTLARANYIVDDAREVAGDEAVRILGERLPPTGGWQP